MDLQEALFSNDSRAFNEGLKSLYLDPKINAKINEWCKYRNVKNKEPDDILQEGIMILVENIQNGKFRGDSKVNTYLLGICKFLILGSAKKKDIISLQGHFQEGDEKVAIPMYDHFEEIEQTEAEQTRDTTLMEIIEKMDEKCQTALKLFYYEKLKMAEIAIKRELKNAQQAKKAVGRCRDKLRIVIKSNPSLIQVLQG